MKVEDGSLRIRSTRTAHAYVGRNAAALTDCGRIRRHRRHGRIARRPLPLRRPARRHHQYRRSEGSSRRKSRRSSTGMPRCACRAPDRAAARSPAPSWSPTSSWPRAATPVRSDEIREENSGRLPGVAGVPQGARRDQVRRRARHHDGGKAGPTRCIMFW